VKVPNLISREDTVGLTSVLSLNRYRTYGSL